MSELAVSMIGVTDAVALYNGDGIVIALDVDSKYHKGSSLRCPLTVLNGQVTGLI